MFIATSTRGGSPQRFSKATDAALLGYEPRETITVKDGAGVVMYHGSARNAGRFLAKAKDGAVPYTSQAEKADWQIEPRGWVPYDRRSNTYGTGRQPFATQAEAQAWVDKENAAYEKRVQEYNKSRSKDGFLRSALEGATGAVQSALGAMTPTGDSAPLHRALDVVLDRMGARRAKDAGDYSRTVEGVEFHLGNAGKVLWSSNWDKLLGWAREKSHGFTTLSGGPGTMGHVDVIYAGGARDAQDVSPETEQWFQQIANAKGIAANQVKDLWRQFAAGEDDPAPADFLRYIKAKTGR